MKYNKVYVIAPERTVTGGVELAHQLVDYLRTSGQEAYIVYSKWNSISDSQEITDAYKCYNIVSTAIVDDNPNNMLVLPEIYFDYILQYTKIQIGCWWMSVDNRYYRIKWYEKIYRLKGNREKVKYIRDFLLGNVLFYNNTTKLLKKDSSRITHFYQSRYCPIFQLTLFQRKSAVFRTCLRFFHRVPLTCPDHSCISAFPHRLSSSFP